MAWDFETEPEFEAKLEWMRGFVREEIIPLEVLNLTPEQIRRATAPLKEEVKAQGLWAAHLDPELGGQGFGQLKLGLMHEILGECFYAPQVFGNNAPDSGNAELIAIAGSDEQKKRWLAPLLEGEIRSAFSMTEPGAGADPTLIKTRAERVGDELVINGHKWFTSNGSIADILIVMAVTNPDVHPYQGMSMIVVPRNTPGVNVLRNIPTMGEHDVSLDESGHAEIIYEDVRVPYENLLGGEGQAFVLAQKRLGPGRIHHVMRWIGQSNRALRMLCERAVSRVVFGEPLARKQTIQNWIADTDTEIRALKLLTLQAAWKMDKEGSSATRKEIAAIKFWGGKVLHDAIDRAIQVHGSLGFTTDLPLEAMYRAARDGRIYDGPDEVHRMTVARQVLKGYEAVDVPTEHVPTRRAEAQRKFAWLLEEATANL
ncbi:MAG TPA: acyl-CoA dehydrogenase family protein [Actinomycetota bacterium]|jgi:acyl-CoA dehydrogenase|nr:acyl-CoA dehydrogenase family protein [Actinomycetota bacterium]